MPWIADWARGKSVPLCERLAACPRLLAWEDGALRQDFGGAQAKAQDEAIVEGGGGAGAGEDDKGGKTLGFRSLVPPVSLSVLPAWRGAKHLLWATFPISG